MDRASVCKCKHTLFGLFFMCMFDSDEFGDFERCLLLFPATPLSNNLGFLTLKELLRQILRVSEVN